MDIEQSIEEQLIRVEAEAEKIKRTPKPNADIPYLDFEVLQESVSLVTTLKTRERRDLVPAAQLILDRISLPDLDYDTAERELLILKLRRADLAAELQQLITLAITPKYDNPRKLRIAVSAQDVQLENVVDELKYIEEEIIKLSDLQRDLYNGLGQNEKNYAWLDTSKLLIIVSTGIDIISSATSIAGEVILSILREVREKSIELWLMGQDASVKFKDKLAPILIGILQSATSGLEKALLIVKGLIAQTLTEEEIIEQELPEEVLSDDSIYLDKFDVKIFADLIRFNVIGGTGRFLIKDLIISIEEKNDAFDVIAHVILFAGLHYKKATRFKGYKREFEKILSDEDLRSSFVRALRENPN